MRAAKREAWLGYLLVTQYEVTLPQYNMRIGQTIVFDTARETAHKYARENVADNTVSKKGEPGSCYSGLEAS
jgi:hypothetical protein